MSENEKQIWWTRFTFPGFGGKPLHEVEIRPLTFGEISDLLRAARNTEWYGRIDLIERVVSCGVKGEGKAIKSTVHALAIVAREIWILTLRDIVSRARAICRAAGITHQLPRVRRYRFQDLATPGMLLHLAEQSEGFDVEAYTRQLVESSVADVTIGGRSVEGSERAAMIAKAFEWLAEKLLTLHGVDGHLSTTLPATVFPTLGHRFFAANQLFMTLDWVQFRSVIYAYNSAVDAAARRSHELSGLERQENSPLITGVPMFFDTVMPTRSLPIEIAPQLLYDATETKLTEFSQRHRRVLRRTARAALEIAVERVRAYPKPDDIPEADRQEITAAVLMSFIAGVNRSPRVVQRACVVYVEKFKKHSSRLVHEKLDVMRRDLRILEEPDAYMLVEGRSDEVYFARFLELLGEDSLFVKVEPRQGSSTIERRALDILSDGARCVITIVDADAEKEHANLKRVLTKSLHSEAFILRGMIEDQFGDDVHAAALNIAYGEGGAVSAADLAAARGDAVSRLKRITWERKNAVFDKVAHAKVIAQLLVSQDQIPQDVRQVIVRTVALAKCAAEERPKPLSYLSLDARTRDGVRRFERLKREAIE